jgi:hypothetical protein
MRPPLNLRGFSYVNSSQGLHAIAAFSISYCFYTANVLLARSSVSSVCMLIILKPLSISVQCRRHGSKLEVSILSWSVWWRWYVQNQWLPALGILYSGRMTFRIKL